MSEWLQYIIVGILTAVAVWYFVRLRKRGGCDCCEIKDTCNKRRKDGKCDNEVRINNTKER